MNHRKEPQWLKDAPRWFQGFYCNDFYHLELDVNRNRRWLYVVVAAVLTFAIAAICSGIF